MIKRDSLNRSTELGIVVEFLKQEIKDKASRTRLDDFEQGVKIGELKILDLLISLCGTEKWQYGKKMVAGYKSLIS